MQGNVFTTGFYRISEWIMRLTIVNVLWILFILVGGIIFGIGPSTAAMFSVMRKWVMGKDDVAIFKTFWSSYRKEFKKANILMLILLVIGYVLFLDLKLFQMQEGAIFLVFRYIMIALMIILLVMMMYILPLFVHYDLKLFQYYKNAFLFSIMHPVLTIIMGAACGLVFFILFNFPVLIPFFGGSSFSIVLMGLTYRSFINIERAETNLEQGVEER